jgi:hypothetical protein
MTATATTEAPTTTDATEFGPDQPVTVALPGGRTIDGWFTELLDGEDAGKARVRYERNGEEKFTKAAVDKITAREVAPAPATPATASKRPALPEGYVTPVGLTNIINERGLYNGGVGQLRSQAMYSYIKNAPADHPFPLETINNRDVVKIEAGVQWWNEKNERVAARAQAAQARREATPSTELRDARAAQRRAASVAKKANEAFDAADARLRELAAKVAALRAEATTASAVLHAADVAVAELDAPAVEGEPAGE